MAQSNVTINFNAKMNISDIKTGINQIQKNLDGLSFKDKNLKNTFSDIFRELNSELDEYQNKLTNGFKTGKDVTGLEKTGSKINSILSKLGSTLGSLEGVAVDDLFSISPSVINDLEKIDKQITAIFKDISNEVAKSSTEINDALSKITTKAASQKGAEIKGLIDVGEFDEANRLIEASIKEQERYLKSFKDSGKNLSNIEANLQGFKDLKDVISGLDITKIEQYQATINELESSKIEKINNALEDSQEVLQDSTSSARNAATAMDTLNRESIETANSQRRVAQEMGHLKSQVEAFFSATTAIHLFKRAINSAYETVKQLDAAMTETAVVTEFTVGDMWEDLPLYTKTAKELGATTLGAYETMTLFYQQGLKTNEAFELGTETMKMARIAGMEYKEATDMMTAALRGFNMELNETSAQKINDVYSELAAITAADTQEIASAMTRTASIANSAGMEFETTSAFLSQMIETTREAPENLGTAMKTIIARFQELKKSPTGMVEVDGETVELNKIDTALKSIGVTLTDTNGQFRDLDDVFLEIAGKWEGLDKNTQRYIATIAAGSRQQSRFIAMMSNYDRTMELVGAANNSAGASQRQFEKTLDSLQAKLNNLQNAWNEYTMGLANSTVIKGTVDLLTGLLTVINKLTGAFGDGVGGILKFGVALGGFNVGRTIFDSFAKTSSEFKVLGTESAGNFSTAFIKNIGANFKSQNNKLKELFKNFIPNLNEKMIQDKINMTNIKFDLGMDDTSSLDEILFKLRSVREELQLGGQGEGQNASQERQNKLNELKDAISNLNEEQKKLIETGEIENITDIKGIGLKIQETSERFASWAAMKAETRATLASAAAQEAENAADAQGNVIRGQETASRLLNTKAIWKTAKNFGSGIISLVKAIPGPAKAAAAAVVLIGVALREAYKQSPEFKLKEAQKRTAEMKQTADSAKQSYDNLMSSISNYQEASNGLNTLTKGTLEWKQAIIEVNQKVLELLKTYPELAEYISNEDGVLSIDTEGIEEITNKQMEAAQKAQSSYMAAQYNENRAQTKVYEKRREPDLNASNWDYTPEEDAAIKRTELDIQIQASKTAEEASLANYSDTLIENAIKDTDLKAGIGEFYSKVIAEDYEKGLEAAKLTIFESGSDLEELYSETFGVPVEEISDDLKDDADAMKEAIAGAKLSEQFESEMSNFETVLASKTEEQQKILLRFLEGGLTSEDIESFESFGDKENWAKSLGFESLQDMANAFGTSVEGLTKVIETTVTTATENINKYQTQLADIIGNNPELEAALNKFTSDMTSEQLKAIVPQLERINAFEGGEGLTLFLNNIESFTKKLDPKDSEKFLNAISALDLSDSESIKDLSELLKGMGLEGKFTEKELSQLEKELINLGHATKTIDVQKLIKAISGVDEAIAEIEGRENDADREFTQEQYDQFAQLLDKNFLSENFIQDNEGNWVFVGNSLNTIIALLQQQVDEASQYAQITLDKQVELGSVISEMNKRGQEDLQGIGTGTKAIADFSKNDLLGYAAALQIQVDENATAEGIYAAISDVWNQVYGENGQKFADNLATAQNYNAFENYSSMQNVYKNTQQEDSTEINQQKGQEAIEMNYKTTEGAEEEYKALLKQNNITEESIAKNKALQLQLKATATDEARLAKKVREADKAIEENAETLKAGEKNTDEYKKAVQQVSTALTKYLGIPVDTSFVEDNLDDIIAMSNGSEEALKRVAEAAQISAMEATGAFEDYENGIRGALDEINSLDEQGFFDKEFSITSSYDGNGVAQYIQDLLGVQSMADLTEEKLQEFNDRMAGTGLKLNKVAHTEEVSLPNYVYQQEGIWGKVKGAAKALTARIQGKTSLPLTTYTLEWEKTGAGSGGGGFKGDAANFTPRSSGGSSSGGGGGGGGDKQRDTKKVKEYAEPLDKLHNVYQRINKELRMINKYQERYNRLLEDAALTGNKLIKNTDKQKKYNELVIKNAKKIEQGRKKEIKDILNRKVSYTHTVTKKEAKKSKKYIEGDEIKKYGKEASKYFSYDKNYNLVTVKDITAYNKLRKTNPELFEKLEEIRSQLDDYQSDIEEANDNREDAVQALKDIEEQAREAYRTLEDRVYAALVFQEQERIDKLSEINDSINNANADLINSIQTNLDKIRQDRANEETEKDIASKERRLAYLRRDTSNANALEIKQLEKELGEQKQDYTDTLIDQKINELQQQNDEAAEQRQLQIDLLQNQLDWDEKNGVFWDKAHELIKDGFDKNTGAINKTSEMVEILQRAEGWAALSEVGKEDWFKELNQIVSQSWEFLFERFDTLLDLLQGGIMKEGDTIEFNKSGKEYGKEGKFTGTILENGNVYYEGAKGDNVHFEIPPEALEFNTDGTFTIKKGYSMDQFRRFDIENETSDKVKETQTFTAVKKGGGGLTTVTGTRTEDGRIKGPSGTIYPYLVQDTKGKFYTPKAKEFIEKHKDEKAYKQYAGIKWKYKTGGIADFTGPAWLDGTPSKPELVLNQKDTQNFIQLKDVLRSLLNGGTKFTGNNGGDNYYEVKIEVDKLESDYDVEQVADKVKRMINSDARYRNVNSINKLR